MTEEDGGARPEEGQGLIDAIGHPTRAKILAVLSDRTANAKEIADEIGEPVGRIRYHLRSLRASGLILASEEKGRRGVVEYHYQAATTQLLDEAQVAELTPQQRRSLVTFLMRLIFNDVSSALRSGTIDERDDFGITRVRLEVDREGWRELARLHLDVLDQVQRVRAESRARLRGTAEAAITVTWAMLLLEMAAPSRDVYP